MTNQEAFTKVVLHLRKQGEKSQNEDKTLCLYRGPNGLMCAVGCLIPDEEYRPELESSVVDIIYDKVDSLKGLNIDMLTEVQKVHDMDCVTVWEDKFRHIAKEFSLEVPA
jgi:hypothetical protein